MSRYSREQIFRIYDDDLGFYVEIGPDGDGLDAVELRYCEKNQVHQRMVLPQGSEDLIAESIKICAEAIRQEKLTR